jgi:hypothetical protein
MPGGGNNSKYCEQCNSSCFSVLMCHINQRDSNFFHIIYDEKDDAAWNLSSMNNEEPQKELNQLRINFSNREKQ